MTTAANGHEALKQVETNRPDLLILDWMMPEPDGLKVLRTLVACRRSWFCQTLEVLEGDFATKIAGA